ncbi:hypothetical protein ACFOY8_13780 [Thalassospira xianhensis]|nr:hypothetical protein [Thalassospira xianhensis]RCK07748.1 hypothetical protein TH5_01495 [Thalassospira xianhensis MCCC 1A02616]
MNVPVLSSSEAPVVCTASVGSAESRQIVKYRLNDGVLLAPLTLPLSLEEIEHNSKGVAHWKELWDADLKAMPQGYVEGQVVTADFAQAALSLMSAPVCGNYGALERDMWPTHLNTRRNVFHQKPGETDIVRLHGTTEADSRLTFVAALEKMAIIDDVLYLPSIGPANEVFLNPREKEVQVRTVASLASESRQRFASQFFSVTDLIGAHEARDLFLPDEGLQEFDVRDLRDVSVLDADTPAIHLNVASFYLMKLLHGIHHTVIFDYLTSERDPYVLKAIADTMLHPRHFDERGRIIGSRVVTLIEMLEDITDRLPETAQTYTGTFRYLANLKDAYLNPTRADRQVSQRAP